MCIKTLAHNYRHPETASRESARRLDNGRRGTEWKDLPSMLAGARLTEPTDWPVAGVFRGPFGHPGPYDRGCGIGKPKRD